MVNCDAAKAPSLSLSPPESKLTFTVLMLAQSNILDADARNVGYKTKFYCRFFQKAYLLHFRKSTE